MKKQPEASVKNIKDYLYLYIGCEVLVQGEERKGYLTGVTNGGYECEIQYQLVDNPHHLEEEPEFSSLEDVGLILRPLSDMTEEELQGCGNLVYDFSDDDSGLDLNNHRPDDFLLTTSEQFHWLIQRQFDVFGLIDAGIAIDKTKLP